MFVQSFLIAVGFVVGFAAAAPAPAPAPAPTPEPVVIPAPNVAHAKRSDSLEKVTMILVNSMSNAVSTSIASNEGSMTLVSGAESTMGTLASQATATYVAPLGWSGNVALVEDTNGVQISGNGLTTLMEFGLTAQGDINKVDVDASYVNGYSVSLTCHCNDGSNTFLSGCPIDLWNQGEDCDQDGEQNLKDSMGACQNPYRDEGTGNGETASPFFQPCQHKAYTFYNDDTANSNGICLSGTVTCCVGTEADGCSA